MQGTDSDDDSPLFETNHFFTADGEPIFLTEDEEYIVAAPEIQGDEIFILANNVVLEKESEDYQRGYMNVLSAQQGQYSLRNRNVTISPIQRRKELQMKDEAQKKGKEPANPSSNKAPTAENAPKEKG